jgi:hypothetical protein
MKIGSYLFLLRFPLSSKEITMTVRMNGPYNLILLEVSNTN